MRSRSVSNTIHRLRTFWLPTAVAVLGTCSAIAESNDLAEAIATRVKEVFDFNRDAVVKIQSSDRHGRIEGSGFYTDPAGTIFTLIGVLGDGKDITVTQGGRKLPAKVLVTDPRTGIAILKVDANTPFIPLANSDEVDVSMPVMAIGYPMGKAASPSFGLVAGMDTEFLGRYFRITHIRTNVPVQRGLGGAPVLNMDGKAIGIVLAGVDGNSGCYIVPSNAAEKIHLDYARFGELRPGKIGASVEPVDPQNLAAGTTLVDIEKDSPAAKAGLKNGDIIVRVGAIEVHSPEDIFDASFYLTAGDPTTIAVVRDGRTLEMKIRPDPTRPETQIGLDGIDFPENEFPFNDDEMSVVGNMPDLNLDQN